MAKIRVLGGHAMAGTTVFTPEWMPVREAAARLGCDRKTITNRINAGTITGVRVVRIGRVVRLNRADWSTYLDRLASEEQQAA